MFSITPGGYKNAKFLTEQFVNQPCSTLPVSVYRDAVASRRQMMKKYISNSKGKTGNIFKIGRFALTF